MPGYEPIHLIDEEAAARPMTDADRLRERWEDLRAAAGEDRVRAAVDGERWRAAVETGVIERLYEVSLGVTEAIVRSGLEADEALQLDAEVYDQIAAHHHAERVVVDAVRHAREPTTSLIRELHAAVTHAQSHYTAYDQFGRAFRRALAHGEYKDHDNHVTLPDGTVHEYAPATQVASEMDRLVEMVGKAASDHPVRLAAFAHHRFAQIHPFADGNGRTARLLSSFLLVRGGFLPLIVTREDRNKYLMALREADQRTVLALVEFSISRLRHTLRVVEKRVFEPDTAGRLGGLSSALASYAARRRVAREVETARTRELVEPVVNMTGRVLSSAMDEAFTAFREEGFETYQPPAHLGGRDEFVLNEAQRLGLQVGPATHLGSVVSVFRIGAGEERQLVVGVVPVSSEAEPSLVLVLADLGQLNATRIQAEPLTLTPDQVHEHEIRRWIEDWLGRMLVDYAQRL